MDNQEHLLSVKNLHTSFYVPAGEVRSVSGITFDVDKGKILGIVGESGSGKSVTAASLMQILTESGHVLPGSSIVFEGEELVGMDEKELRKIRGDKIAMIFQDPMTALNPVYKIGHQMEEAILLHKKGKVEVLTEPQAKALRDRLTSLNRLEQERKPLLSEKRLLTKDGKKDQALDERIASLEEGIKKAKKDILLARADLKAASQAAEGVYAYEKEKAKLDFEYEKGKRLLELANAYRGLFSERIAEKSRYSHERQDALRDLKKREFEKLFLLEKEEEKRLMVELSKKLQPLYEKEAEDLSKEERKALRLSAASLKKEYGALILASREKSRLYEQEAHDRLALCRREARLMDKKRSKALLSARRATIKQARLDLRQAYEEYRSVFKATKSSARKRCIEMLSLVGITNPEKRMEQYPFEFSGGMLQRVMIAMALLSDPDLLIADEPTTALDVTIQAQILELIKSIQKKLGMGVIIITHDLGVVAQICDEVDVMYAGRIVERGSVDEIFYNPQHEYTKGLLASIPGENAAKGQRLHPIEGNPVDVFALPKGCSFAPRCEKCMEVCLQRYPAERKVSAIHYASCFRAMALEISKGNKSIDDFVKLANESFVVADVNVAKSKAKKEGRKGK